MQSGTRFRGNPPAISVPLIILKTSDGQGRSWSQRGNSMACNSLGLSLPVHGKESVHSCTGTTLKRKRMGRKNSTVSAYMSTNDPRLLEAAKHVVDLYVRSGMVVGLGTGPASAMAIKQLGQKLKVGNLKDIVGVSMSTFSATEAAKAGIPLKNDVQKSDFAFDDADVIEEGTIAAVIGRRKGQESESIMQEKSVLKGTDNLVFIISKERCTRKVDGSIPVLVRTDNWIEIAEQIDDMFLGDAEVWRRPSYGFAGPLGGDFPLVTREGHYILDVIFTSPVPDLAKVAESLEKIDGVINHGVIHGLPCRAVIASDHGLQTVDNLAKLGVGS